MNKTKSQRNTSSFLIYNLGGESTLHPLSVVWVPLSIRGILLNIVPGNVRWIWASCGRCVPLDGGGSSRAMGELADEGRRQQRWFLKVLLSHSVCRCRFPTLPSSASPLSNSRNRHHCDIRACIDFLPSEVLDRIALTLLTSLLVLRLGQSICVFSQRPWCELVRLLTFWDVFMVVDFFRDRPLCVFSL